MVPKGPGDDDEEAPNRSPRSMANSDSGIWSRSVRLSRSSRLARSSSDDADADADDDADKLADEVVTVEEAKGVVVTAVAAAAAAGTTPLNLMAPDVDVSLDWLITALLLLLLSS